MSLKQTISYDTPGNFTYDDRVIEVTGGVARLKDITPAGATFYAGFHTGIDGEYGGGVLTGTATGSAAASGGKLDLTGGTTQYVDYHGAGNADNIQAGAIRFKVTPGYSGSPASEQCFFVIQKGPTGGDTNNQIKFCHLANGQLNLICKDKDKAGITTTNLGAWSPVSGTEYEIELNYNFTTGATRLFINGTQFGSTISSTGTRDSAISEMRWGSDEVGGDTANFKLDEIILFSAVQHTASFTSEIPRIDQTKYSTANPTIVNNSGVTTDDLVDFIETATKPTNTQIKYQLLEDGIAKWFNGSAWVTSDGSYSEANLASEIMTNKGSLDLSDGVTLKVQALLHSEYGNAGVSLTSVEVDYSFFVAEPTAPSHCIVYAYLEDILGQAVGSAKNAKLQVTNKKPFVHSGHFIGAFNLESVDFDDSGYAEIELVETETLQKTYDFFISYTDDSGTAQLIVMKALTVPNQVSVSLATLADL